MLIVCWMLNQSWTELFDTALYSRRDISFCPQVPLNRFYVLATYGVLYEGVGVLRYCYSYSVHISTDHSTIGQMFCHD